MEQRYPASLQNPDNYAEKQDAYVKKLEGMTDEELFDEAKSKIWLSAYANNNPRSCFHWQCDATYDEAKRREKPEIYSRAHKANVDSL